MAIILHCHVFKTKKSHVITVKVNPCFSNASLCSIELNPSHFENLKNTTDLVHQVSDKELFIKRIDFAVDINRPLEEIRKSIKVKHKRARHDYPEKDIFTGFYLGSDHEIICVYDKAYELLKRGKYRLIKGSVPEQITRIELRQRGKKILYKNYSDIEKYITINPFSIIEFYKLDHQKQSNEFSQFRAFKLLTNLEESGCLHGAIKRMNKNNNFKRDHKYLIRNTDLEKHIADKFKQSLSDFLGSYSLKN